MRRKRRWIFYLFFKFGILLRGGSIVDVDIVDFVIEFDNFKNGIC